MSITILETRESIDAAIAIMDPIAREAAQLLAHRMLDDPSTFENEGQLIDEWSQSCAISCARAGIHPTEDEAAFSAFVENHGSAVLNVAFSIAVFVVREAERERKWGWVGKAAAVAVGAALGSFFG